MGSLKKDNDWCLPDEIWAQMEPLLPPRKPHPLGGHNPRVSDRAAMDAILFVHQTSIFPACSAFAFFTNLNKVPRGSTSSPISVVKI
jgi:hypothetical protein